MPPRVQPGNPQWVDIVEAKARRLEETGAKSFQTYKRAAKSLRDCPIIFDHPDEALVLNGIGKQIAKDIADKVNELALERGLPPLDRHAPSPPRRKAPAATTKKKRAREEEEAEEDRKREARRLRTQGLAAPAAPPALGFQAHPDGAFSGLPEDVSDDDEGGTTGGKGKGKAKEKGKRAYIPKKESGAYAILLALYINSSFDERYQLRTKAEIVRDGTKYSKTPFEKATANKGGVAVEGGQASYSAWSGMAILLTKELVLKDNKRPAKFQLSPEGYQLAERLAPDAGIVPHVYHPSSSNGHPSSSGRERHPSSSGYDGNGAAGPSSGGIISGSFAGRGQTLGGQNSSIHGQIYRPRSPTPLDFLDGPTEDPEELELRRALKESLELSRSGGGGGDPVLNVIRQNATRAAEGRMVGPGATSSSTAFRPAGSTSSGISGRKAALGNIGASTAANQAPQGPSVPNVDGAFSYYYLTETGARATDRDLAEVSQSEDGADQLYRVEYRIAQDLHSMRRGLHKVEKLTRSVPLAGGQTMSGYMKERVSNATAPGFPESALSGGNGASKPKEKKQSDDPFSSLLAGFQDKTSKSKDAMYQPPAEIRRLGGGRGGGGIDLFEPVSHKLPPVKKSQTLDIPPHQAIAGPSNSRKSASQPNAEPFLPRPVAAPARPLAPSASAALASNPIRAPPGTTSKRPLQVCYESLPGQTRIERHPLIPFSEPKPVHLPPFQPIIWPAGSFKVFLMIDTREGTREGGKRIEFCDKFAREGVRVDRAMLPLGDMIWVARRVDQRGNKIAGEQDVVLDAIVERKRLDDLIDSIKDGRYVGQKIRLKDSAITDRIYLIEKYDDKTAYETYGKAIWTCKSQLQVIDGFYVHESGNVEETLNYLKMRTQIMAETYENSEIRIIPDQVIDRSSYVSLQHHLRTTQPSHRYLTTYSSFFELNKPDAGLTIRIQWASMIQRIKGMSAEKAIQFLGRWETAVQFYEEANRWEVEIAEENRRLDREEAEGRGPKGKGKAKRRKKEDFVVSSLGETTLPRPIKGKLGSDIWALLMTEDKY